MNISINRDDSDAGNPSPTQCWNIEKKIILDINIYSIKMYFNLLNKIRTIWIGI